MWDGFGRVAKGPVKAHPLVVRQPLLALFPSLKPPFWSFVQVRPIRLKHRIFTFLMSISLHAIGIGFMYISIYTYVWVLFKFVK
jgi:hypothetical protein